MAPSCGRPPLPRVGSPLVSCRSAAGVESHLQSFRECRLRRGGITPGVLQGCRGSPPLPPVWITSAGVLQECRRGGITPAVLPGMPSEESLPPTFGDLFRLDKGFGKLCAAHARFSCTSFRCGPHRASEQASAWMSMRTPRSGRRAGTASSKHRHQRKHGLSVTEHYRPDYPRGIPGDTTTTWGTSPGSNPGHPQDSGDIPRHAAGENDLPSPPSPPQVRRYTVEVPMHVCLRWASDPQIGCGSTNRMRGVPGPIPADVQDPRVCWGCFGPK
jgi:hypothetical protein